MGEKENQENEFLENQAERLEKEALDKDRQEQERLEKEKQEQERLEKWKKQNRLVINNMLFIIPNWTRLLGYHTLGKYVNQNVEKIHSDIVIFFVGTECSVETERGVLYFVFGLGYYFTKFEVKSGVGLAHGKYIVDNRTLTGLILPDFVYDQLASSKRITLEREADVIVAEDIIKVPMDLSFKAENQIIFIKGALMRNLFIPNKDIFLEMMEKINSAESYKLENTGHLLLSAHWDHYNKILVSEKMKSSFYKDYLNTTAGLSEICYGADDFLNKTFSPVELEKVSRIMKILKDKYSIIKYDTNYFYSIIQNAADALKKDFPEGLSQQMPSTEHKEVKASVLFSAENRKSSIKNWPIEFKRQEKEDVEVSLPHQKPEVLPGVKVVEPPYDVDLSKLKDYREPQRDTEDFKLRLEKSEKVEKKTLPPPPEGDIEAILLYVKWVLEENFEMRAVGKAFAMARDNLRKVILQADYMWEMSKYSNIYLKKPPSLGLSLKDKNELTEKVDNWILAIQKEKRKEQERIEKEKLEKERKEKEEREKLEKEKREREQKEREKQELEKLEHERQLLQEKKKELEKLEIIKQEREKAHLERERLEQERLEKVQAEKERLEKERIQQQLEKDQLEREALKKEKKELKKMKQERKQREKKEKQQKKKDQKLEKEKKKLEQLRQKEESLKKS